MLRIVTGLSMLVHGSVRVCGSYGGFVQWIHGQFSRTFLPESLLTMVGYGIPLVEIVIGLSLIGGLLTFYGLILSGLLMSVLVFGMCLLQNWSTVADQMIYTFIFAALLFGLEYNHFSLDRFILNSNPAHNGDG